MSLLLRIPSTYMAAGVPKAGMMVGEGAAVAAATTGLERQWSPEGTAAAAGQALAAATRLIGRHATLTAAATQGTGSMAATAAGMKAAGAAVAGGAGQRVA